MKKKKMSWSIGVRSSLIALVIVSPVCMFAQAKDWRSTLQDTLESQYSLTKATADKSSIVTAGAILVLKKDDSGDVHDVISNPAGEHLQRWADYLRLAR